MTHLYLFTITPVQSFIAQARKTQDLWAGSRILSDLVKEAIRTINLYKDIYDAEIIFPSVKADKLDDISSLPNRILAEFTFPEDFDEKTIKNIGKSIADAIIREIGFDQDGNYNQTGFIKKAEEYIGLEEYDKIKLDFENQLKNYFSTFWVFVPFETDYQTTYDNADRLLGAVKNARTFIQNPEKGRKCSLSGEQNALIFNHDTLPNYTFQVAQISSTNMGSGEGLSAMSFLKRTYKGASSFDSTARISLLKDLEKFAKDGLKNYKTLFDGFFDEQLYFEENLTPRYFQKNGLKSILHNGKIPQKILDEHKNLRKVLKIKYYAILIFDADSMGAWLSGEYLNDKNKLYDFHKHLSGLLSDFADYAKDYVDGKINQEKQKGRTVYAGGDDYLGFINLYYLLDVLKHLREQFDTQISQRLSKKGTFSLSKSAMTFSAGVAIAHYKTPLSEVLTWAKKMEKAAKETDDKDSFGIAVLKHSGEMNKAVLPFKNDNNWLSDRLSHIISELNGNYSSKFITNIEQEFYLLADSDDDRIHDALKHEIARLLKRAKIKKEANLDAILSHVIAIHKDAKSYHNFQATLNICDFIHRKLKGND